jgi:hypothetical protein
LVKLGLRGNTTRSKYGVNWKSGTCETYISLRVDGIRMLSL